MTGEPTIGVYPRGLGDEFPDGPPTAVVTHLGLRFILRFDEGDFRAEGPLQELRLLPDKGTLDPRALRRFSPQAELYLSFAQAAMRVLGPEGTPASRRERLIQTSHALQAFAGPGRALTDGFYRGIAEEYKALVQGGEPHPVKTLGEAHHVTISAASRWLKEARRRGLIDG